MNSMPLVSIIIPTFNRSYSLPKVIDSITKQTYSNWELLIIDDGSTDNTNELINTYSQKDARIKYLINGRRKGPASARNCGVLKSTGDFIAFLDSDDEWFENHLYDSINAIKTENVNICFSLWVEKSKHGDIYKAFDTKAEKDRLKRARELLNLRENENRIVFPSPDFFEFTNIESLYCYHINTMVISRSVLNKVGLFNEKLLASEDLDFVLRTIHDFEFCLILDHHFIYNQGEDNIHSFIDRRKLKADDIYCPSTVKKLTFCGIYKCKMLRIMKRFIISSPKIKEKKLCINAYNKKIDMKYFTLGIINGKENKLKAIYFLCISLSYKFSVVKIKHIINIMFPFVFKNMKIDMKDLWLY